MSTENKPDFEKTAENLIYENLAIDDYPELKADITQALQSAYEAGQPKWREIETAPKNTKLIDLWGGEKRYSDYTWNRGAWRKKSSGQVLHNPTHYMPLPNPPSVSSVDNGEETNA